MSTAAPHSFEEIVVDLAWRPAVSRPAAGSLAKDVAAARLRQLQRNRAMDAAHEAELILRLAAAAPRRRRSGAGQPRCAEPDVAEDRAGVPRGQ